MLCENPYMSGVLPCSCGQCDPCRSRRKRLWASRIMLESLKHRDNAFVTLTYADKYLPTFGVVKTETLNPKHLQKWLKRLRLAVLPRKLRYYACGEYGDDTWRPHYHAVVFNLSPLEVDTVRTSWGMGHVVVGELTSQSAAYVAGYVTKKMTSCSRLNVREKKAAIENWRHGRGKHPEFQRMSLRPGVGALAVPDIAAALTNKEGRQYIRETGDVPLALSQARQALPLGRYLRGKLRELLLGQTNTPEAIVQALRQEMSLLFQENVSVAPFEKGIRKILAKNFLLDKFSQERLNFNARNKIYQGAKTI